MQPLRICTYNVHKCAGLDQRVMPRRIADVIRTVNPHVVGLQEVIAPQAQQIAEYLGMEIVLGEVRRISHDLAQHLDAVSRPSAGAAQ